jgi:hypothetical protein
MAGKLITRTIPSFLQDSSQKHKRVQNSTSQIFLQKAATNGGLHETVHGVREKVGRAPESSGALGWEELCSGVREMVGNYRQWRWVGRAVYIGWDASWLRIIKE